MEAILSYEDDVNDQEVDNVLDDIIETFELDKHGYAISDIRDVMNQSLAEKGMGEICKFLKSRIHEKVNSPNLANNLQQSLCLFPMHTKVFYSI